MSTPIKTVAIIGAGPSGEVAAKSAVECGLKPTIFEKSPNIGGLWQPKVGSTWDSMRTNISHYTCMFSDFAWKPGTQDFPNQKEVYEYLCDYMKTFQLDQYLHLNTEVTKITKLSDQWKVETVENSQQKEELFDFVIVASGIFSKAAMPPLPGREKFKGYIFHSNDYKRPEGFVDKHVTILGNAFSGCEIASDAASTAKHVSHIASKSFWIIPRYLTEKKLPADLIFYSRAADLKSKDLPLEQNNASKNSWFRSLCVDQEKYPELKNDTDLKAPPFVAISDSYVKDVEEKRIDVKKLTIDHLEADKIVFENGQSENSDAIICCTGYQAALLFFREDVLKELEFKPEDKLQPLLLHKTVFPKNLPGLAFVGMYRGPYFGVMELQARWACMAFSGKVPLPTEAEINLGIEEEKKIRDQQPRPQFPHGNYVGFCEDLARQIGAAPNLEKIKEEGPELHKKLMDGPFTVASYRLNGFGSNPTLARQNIEQINQRVNSN